LRQEEVTAQMKIVCAHKGTKTQRVKKENSCRRFTLLELLATIGIIAILFVLLLPALKNARELAIRTQCMGGQNQLHVAASAFAADNDGYIPYGHHGTAYWGGAGQYWQLVQCDIDYPPTHFLCPNESLTRMGDWDTIIQGSVSKAIHMGKPLRKGNDGYGGQLAPYMGIDNTGLSHLNVDMDTGTETDMIRTVHYREPSGSYRMYFLPRRIATCPGVRPVGDSLSAWYTLDAYNQPWNNASAPKLRPADMKDFFPSYGINVFIACEGSGLYNEATKWYRQFKFSQIANPSRLWLFADRPHALMDYQQYATNMRPWIGVGFLAPLYHTLPDVIGGAYGGGYGPYAPEPRHGKMAAMYVDGHVETLLWSNYEKTSGGEVYYSPGRAFPGCGHSYPQYTWPGIYQNGEYWDLPFVNRMGP
jgi:type II secretory pathway pseudopilin PulG